MSVKTRSVDATYPARTKGQRRSQSTGKRKPIRRQSAHSSAFGLALSAGIIGSLGVIVLLTFVLLGG